MAGAAMSRLQSEGPQYRTAPRSDTFEAGLEFQDYVCTRLAREHIILQNLQSKKYQLEIGENVQGFEIKLDARCTETGRLSIEIAEKSDARLASWSESGIYRADNSWLYIQGNYQELFVLGTAWLRRYHAKMKPEEHESHGTVRKFYLPLPEARVWALRVFT